MTGSMLGLIRTHRLVFDDRTDVGGGVSSFAFRSQRPVGARAGQHGVLGLSATAMKPFSLASAPGEDRVQIRQDKYLFYKPRTGEQR